MPVVLSAALALSLAAQCAPGVAPETTVSIARAESGLSPISIHDNTTGRSYKPADVGEAIGLASDLILVQRHSVDVGLMQINSTNLRRLGLSIADAFDACKSMAGGSRVLSAAYQSALRGALSSYNTGNTHDGIANGYVARVIAASSNVPPIQPAAAPAAPASAPPPAPTGIFASASGPTFVFADK